MAKIYRRKCDQCGKYYEGLGKYFCSPKCSQLASQGRIITKKTRKKISKGNKGKKRTQEVKRKISQTRVKNKVALGKNNPNFGRRGKDSPNYGKPRSEETRKKISKAHKGKPRSKKTKEKISKSLKGKTYEELGREPMSEKAKLKNSKSNKNRIVFPEHRKKISKARIKLFKKHPEKILRGENHPNWQDGISFEPYGIEFNNILREQIRERDNYRCQECFRHQDELFTKKGKPYKLHIHHIDYNKQNNNPNNLISLCLGCHMQTNYKREDWTNYFHKQFKK